MKIRNRRKRLNKKQKVLITILSVFLAVILAFGGTFALLYFYGKSSIGKNEADTVVPDDIAAEVFDNGDTIVYNGHKYKYNRNITSVLVMGVDREELTGDYGVGYNGQADANFLCALDTETNTVSVIAISRDTLCDVDVYSASGEFVSTEEMQLCLAYAYGDGKNTSCTNVAKSVSRLLCNMPIPLYASIDEYAVEILNDDIGGVTVPEYINKGSQKTGNMITLHGHDAYTYVQDRSVKYLDSNNTRVERQRAYVDAFIKKAIDQTKTNLRLPVTLYNSITDYMVTNIKIPQVSYIVSNYIDKPLTIKQYSIAGKITRLDEHAALTPDIDKLFQTVLDVFYTEVS